MFNRSESKPYIFGDIFRHISGAELIIVNPLLQTAYFKHHDRFALVHTITPDIAIELGFKPLLENIEESKKIKEWGLFAPRKLKEGIWCALTPLMFTTAICVDYDEISPFVSRYCFEDSNMLDRHENALFWLSQFNDSLSLPIGNVAYRGHLGCNPIADPTITLGYYEMLTKLRYEKDFSGDNQTPNEYARSFLNKYAYDALQDGLTMLSPDDGLRTFFMNL